MCSESTIKTQEQRQWRRSGVFIVDFEYIFEYELNLNIEHFL